MNTLKVTHKNAIKLVSSWQCARNTHSGSKNPYSIVKGPYTGSNTVNFKYSLSSGCVIKSAVIWASLNSPNGGISVLTVNGKKFDQKNGSKKGAKVSLPSNSGTLKAVFKFKSNGKANEKSGTQYSTLTLSNVYLLIQYEGTNGSKETPKQEEEQGFKVPPQSVCIYDQTDKSIYMFDGVTKIQHTLTTDIQKDPKGNEKTKYVNGAKNEPDKLSIEIVMSDVYTGGGAIISKSESLSSVQKKGLNASVGSLIQGEVKNAWTRSSTAFRTIHWLKEQRRKLTVITPQYVHVDMLIASVSVNQDDASPYGWEGKIDFQHAYKPKKKKKKKKTKTGDGTRTPSITQQVIGG